MSVGRWAAAALRQLPPETAHHAAFAALQVGERAPFLIGPAKPRDPAVLATRVGGLSLANPIGLAAGFDKDARASLALSRLGFGFVECGTVTPRPQPGSPKPRLFRLDADRALINRMGFNSGGLELFSRRLARRGKGGVIGANLGANKQSEDRIGDYVTGLQRVWSLVDYVTVNISSPNTPGLRALQQRAALDELLGRLGAARTRLAAEQGARPVFLKVAPDVDDGEIAAIAQAAEAGGVDALIVSNTTVERPDSLTSPARTEAGGLSGRPLFARSTALVSAFRQASGARLPIIAAGGVDSGEAAYAKIRAGAAAVQLYSALIYEGPGLPGRIKRDLAARLVEDGHACVADAVGADAPL
ncbi:MAG: quinone-dependent dihydroorotate dehydrogenase [Caulobacterales bacterium]|nr:quinone-dependent dihydroorotate dehydrogenase [Caulobacterales bacterium]